MTDVILSNRRSFRKDDSNQSGISGLISLGAKLHAMKGITKIAVSKKLTAKELFHLLFGIDDLLHNACQQCDDLDPNQIAADVSAMTAEPIQQSNL